MFWRKEREKENLVGRSLPRSEMPKKAEDIAVWDDVGSSSHDVGSSSHSEVELTSAIRRHVDVDDVGPLQLALIQGPTSGLVGLLIVDGTGNLVFRRLMYRRLDDPDEVVVECEAQRLVVWPAEMFSVRADDVVVYGPFAVRAPSLDFERRAPTTLEGPWSTTLFVQATVSLAGTTLSIDVALPPSLEVRGVGPELWAALFAEVPTKVQTMWVAIIVPCCARREHAIDAWHKATTAALERHEPAFSELAIHAEAFRDLVAPNGWCGPAIRFSWHIDDFPTADVDVQSFSGPPGVPVLVDDGRLVHLMLPATSFSLPPGPDPTIVLPGR